MSKWRHYKDPLWAGGGKTVCMRCKYAFADGAYHHVDEWRYCPMCGAEAEGKLPGGSQMELFVQDNAIHLSKDESDFVAHVANDTCLSIHDLIVLSVLSFCNDEDKCKAIKARSGADMRSSAQEADK